VVCALWLAGLSLAGLLLAGLLGCDVGGIPNPQTSDAGLQDAPSQICTPKERICEGLEVVSCNAAGTAISSQACPLSTACIDGACEPVQTQCDAEDEDDRFSYSVSKSELVFEVADVLKSSTNSLEITNCGDSPITLQTISFGEQPTDHSVLPNVFTFVGPSLEGLQIEPGDKETITVRYQPRYAYSRQSGSLIVKIAGPTFQRFSIALVPKTYCVSATPEVDLGLFDDQAEGSVRVHNCGTEPVELTGVYIKAKTDAADSRVDTSLVFAEPPDDDDELPTLASGEHLEIDVDVAARSLGMLDHQVVFNVADSAKFLDPAPSSNLIGRVVADSCHDVTLDPPRVWGEQMDSAYRWSVDDIPLGEVVFFEMQPLPEPGLQPIFSLVTPEASRARLDVPTAPLATSAKASFAPDVAGRYHVTMNVLDSQGRPMCAPKELDLYARPTSDLYVDLTWKTHGDPIAGDTGFGYGADLNLYLTATDDLIDAPAWDDHIQSCYGLGEFIAARGQETQSNVYQAQCDSAGAQIQSLSVSGAHREIMVVEDISQRFYHIGVRSWSMYDYPGADARLSVYAHGQRVADVDLLALWWGVAGDQDYEAPPGDLDELLGVELSGRQAWHYGVWDAQTNRLLPRPPRRYDGSFP
jgi:hypothetical protein